MFPGGYVGDRGACVQTWCCWGRAGEAPAVCIAALRSLDKTLAWTQHQPEPYCCCAVCCACASILYGLAVHQSENPMQGQGNPNTFVVIGTQTATCWRSQTPAGSWALTTVRLNDPTHQSQTVHFPLPWSNQQCLPPAPPAVYFDLTLKICRPQTCCWTRSRRGC